jgi:hypothetical protein
MTDTNKAEIPPEGTPMGDKKSAKKNHACSQPCIGKGGE